jgi:hypothetical protein
MAARQSTEPSVDNLHPAVVTPKRLLRLVITVLLAFLMVGFGLCGLMGTVGGLASGMQHGWSGRESWAGAASMLQWGLAGLGIAALCGWGVYALQRRRREAGNTASPPDTP